MGTESYAPEPQPGTSWVIEGGDKPVSMTIHSIVPGIYSTDDTLLYQVMMAHHGQTPDEFIVHHLTSSKSGGPVESKQMLLFGKVSIEWSYDPMHFTDNLRVNYIDGYGHKTQYSKTYSEEFLEDFGNLEHAVAYDFILASRTLCNMVNGKAKDLVQISLIHCFRKAMNTMGKSIDYHKFVGEVNKQAASSGGIVTGDKVVFVSNPAGTLHFYSNPNQDGVDKLSAMAYALPGMSKMINTELVPVFCKCFQLDEPEPKISTVANIVIHLNDKHKVSRDVIADWLDSLHDSGVVNLEFGAEEIETEQWKKEMDAIHDDED